MHVIIAGGSLVGLMHGIMLKHHGCKVDIFEQTPQRLEGQAAGVATAANVHHFLALHDRLKEKLAFPTKGIQEVNTQGKVEKRIPLAMAMTTWDALYFRLRANFDGYRSVFAPEPPPTEPGDGLVQYHLGRKVTSVIKNQDDTVTVTYADTDSGSTQTIKADLLIGADGANSALRSLLAPHAPGRQYAGYVMWRGIIPEAGLSPETIKASNEWFSFCTVPQNRDYVVLYPVPGKTGSLQNGEREMNFAWYSQIAPNDLAEALTSVDGHKHNWSVPNGKLNPAVWQKQLRQRAGPLNPACTEIVARIDRPFLQVVGDHAAPQASFLDGRAIIVGDALVTIRPHTGLGISSGAFHVLQLEKALFENKSGQSHSQIMKKWASLVLDYSQMERLKSISWGEYYMGSWFTWLPAAANFHGRVKLNAWRTWAASFF